MAVCSTTALRKYLTQHSNLGQPLREKASSTTRGHAEGETSWISRAYRRQLFKSSQGFEAMLWLRKGLGFSGPGPSASRTACSPSASDFRRLTKHETRGAPASPAAFT